MVYKNIFLVFTFSLFLILSTYTSNPNYFALAQSGSWTTNDKEILMLKDEDGMSVAHHLALKLPNWNTEDKEILELEDKNGESVTFYLENAFYTDLPI